MAEEKEQISSLEEAVKAAAELAEKLPEKFQQKGFEKVLEMLLSSRQQQPMQKEVKTDIKNEIQSTVQHIIPIDVRAFLQQYGIPEEKLQKLFLLHDGQTRPIYKISTTKKAKAQIQLTLLTALEHAVSNGKFEFGIEEIRQRCKDHKCLDIPNFSSIFKKNQNLFKDMVDQEHVELSPEGKTELSEVITEMSK